jgi:hypothetical protein
MRDADDLKRLRNRLRFDWHERLMKREAKIPAAVARYAALVFHDKEFKITNFGYAELPTRKAAKQLKMDRRTVQRIRNWLLRREWFVLIPRQGQEITRYRLNIPAPELVAWPETPDTTKVCAACNKTFEPVRTEARFCSRACRQRAWRVTDKASRLPPPRYG